MIERARTNAEKPGYHNLEFRPGDIESMPVASATADVTVQKDKMMVLPEDILKSYMSLSEIDPFLSGNTGIDGVTVYAGRSRLAKRRRFAVLQVVAVKTYGTR